MKEIYRDTLSQCQPQAHHLYDANCQTPSSVKRPTKQETHDRLESQEQQLQRQLIERFLSSQFRTEHPRGFFFVKGAHLLLMSLIAPPYFLFFTFPKWAATNSIPAAKRLQLLIQQAWKRLLKLQQKIAKAAGKATIPFGKLAKQLGTLAERATSLLNGVRLPSIPQIRLPSLPLAKLLHYPKSWSAALAYQFERGIQQLMKPLQQAFSWASSRFDTTAALAERFAMFVKKSADRIATSVASASHWGRAQLEQPSKRALRALEKVGERTEIIKEAGIRTIEALFKQLAPLQHWVGKGAEIVKQGAEQATNRVAEALQQTAHVVIQPVISLFATLTARFEGVEFKRGRAFFKRFQRGRGRSAKGFAAIKRLVEGVTRKANGFAEWILLKIGRLLAGALAHLVERIKLFVLYLIGILTKCLHFLRLLVFSVRLLFLYSWRSLQESDDSLD